MGLFLFLLSVFVRADMLESGMFGGMFDGIW
jgi:hypothetical protein